MDFLLPLLISMPTSAFPLMGISLGIGLAFVSIYYIIAYAMQSPQMTALAKEELAAFLFTVFIIFFWLTFDTAINGLATGLLTASLPPQLQSIATDGQTFLGLDQTHLHLALGSLDILYTKLKGIYVDLYLYEALIGFLSTVSFPIGSPFPAIAIVSISFAPFTGLAILSNAHTVIVEAVGYIITIVWAKEFILLFARDAVPLFVLPLGIVMRAFPFLRRTGSSIIALGFALYFAFPFALLLSNYLIFDVFQPADFAYTPSAASFFDTDVNQGEIDQKLAEGSDPEGGPTQHLFEQFEAPDVIAETYRDASDACIGNIFSRFLCSSKNIYDTVTTVIGSFLSTIWNIWKFMMGMTGDFFFTLFNNPIMPASASAGLYHFIIMEINTVGPFMILVIFTTVIEIIITVTTYRNIALMIGGEAEIIGITKIV